MEMPAPCLNPSRPWPQHPRARQKQRGSSFPAGLAERPPGASGLGSPRGKAASAFWFLHHQTANTAGLGAPHRVREAEESVSRLRIERGFLAPPVAVPAGVRLKMTLGCILHGSVGRSVLQPTGGGGRVNLAKVQLVLSIPAPLIALGSGAEGVDSRQGAGNSLSSPATGCSATQQVRRGGEFL